MNLKSAARAGFAWSLIIQLSFQLIGFSVSIILARLLTPSDFGIIGIITIFIGIGRTLLDGGLAASLIREKNPTQQDYSTVFWTNVFVAFLLYLLLFTIAPAMAVFFMQPALIDLLRVYGLVLLIGSISIVQSVRLNKNLQFKTQFKLLLPSLIISGAVSVWMAYHGFGVWSLVWKEILFTVIASIQLWLYAKWQPTVTFDWDNFKYHFNFGYKLLLTDILKKFFNDFYKIIIGRYFSVTQLGLYTRAKSMQELPNTILFSAINRVMYPLLANIGEEDARLKNVYRRIISTITYIIVPALVLMLILAKPLFLFLLTDKWIDAVPYFQILIVASIISPMQAYYLNICRVKGRSDLVLKLSIVEYSLLLLGTSMVIWFGIYGLLWSLVIVACLNVYITGYYAGRLVGYKPMEQWIDTFQPLLFSTLSGFSLFLILQANQMASYNHFIVLCIGSLFFCAMYLSLGYIFKNRVLLEGISQIYKR